MNIDELKEVEEESYNKWFERWYEKQDFSNKLKKSAMQGYTAYSYTVKHYDDYTQRRMKDTRFIPLLQSKLEGFKVYVKEPEKYKWDIFGRDMGYRWTDYKIVISWNHI